jgi:hypothetical protein
MVTLEEMYSGNFIEVRHQLPWNYSHTRFWTDAVTGVRRMRAHAGSQSSETGEVQTHPLVIYIRNIYIFNIIRKVPVDNAPKMYITVQLMKMRTNI